MKIIERKCPDCGKTIEGISEVQLDWNMRIHRESKECKRRQMAK